MEQSLKKRGKEWIYIRDKVAKALTLQGRNFYSHDYIEPDARCSWADFCFISPTKKKVFYNATIEIAQSALIENAESIVDEEAAGMFEKFIGTGLDFSVAKVNSAGKPLLYSLDTSRWEKKWPELGSKTFFEWRDDKVDELLGQKRSPVFEEYKLDFSYRCGVGLIMTVDEEIITPEVIERHIKRFCENGEIEWKSDIPIDPEKLVYSHDWPAIRQVSICNAIVDIDFNGSCKMGKGRGKRKTP